MDHQPELVVDPQVAGDHENVCSTVYIFPRNGEWTVGIDSALDLRLAESFRASAQGLAEPFLFERRPSSLVLAADIVGRQITLVYGLAVVRHDHL